ncbi:MAG TPA: hypothetical protein VGF23_06570 [Gaiellaceae bacterium]
MPYFAVTRVPGPAWARSRGMRDQERWDDHAAFMDALDEEGFIVLGGPIGADGLRFMFLVEAGSPGEIEARLAEDPWVPMDLLRLAAVEPWELVLGTPG